MTGCRSPTPSAFPASWPAWPGFAFGGWLVARLGTGRALIATGFVQMASMGLYFLLAYSGGNPEILIAKVMLENFAETMADAAFLSFLSSLCAPGYTATQYALLSSLAVIPLRTVGGFSGFLAQAMGWVPFYARDHLRRGARHADHADAGPPPAVPCPREADRRSLGTGRQALIRHALFMVFSRIGLTSFGGGLSGWMLREFVQRRLAGRGGIPVRPGLAQAFPGVNVVNIAIWIGYPASTARRGALAGFTGIVVPPALLVVAIAAGFAALARFPVTHLVLDGIGAAAIGLSLQMGLIAGRRALAKGVWQTVLMILAFVGGRVAAVVAAAGCGGAGRAPGSPWPIGTSRVRSILLSLVDAIRAALAGVGRWRADAGG